MPLPVSCSDCWIAGNSIIPDSAIGGIGNMNGKIGIADSIFFQQNIGSINNFYEAKSFIAE